MKTIPLYVVAPRFPRLGKRGGEYFQGLEKAAVPVSKPWKTCWQHTARWVALVAVACAARAEQAPRLALIAQPKDAATADLLFSKLAASDKIALVEREKLQRVLTEKDLASFSRTNQLAVGRLLQAEGLLVLEQEGELLQLRLVETQRGQVVEVFAAHGSGAEQPAALTALAQQVEAVGAKLALQPGQRLYVAAMPLVAETPDVAQRANLPTINTLLNIQLSRYASLILVEREALAAVQVEKELGAETLQGVSVADYILRGRATLQADGRILVRYQVQRNERTPGAAPLVEALLDARRLNESTAELARQLAAVMTRAGPSATRSLRGEAASLFALGAYHAAHQRTDPGLRYLESAHALAPTQVEYADLLLDMYAVLMSKPNDRWWFAYMRSLRSSAAPPPYTADAQLERRVELLLRALQTAEEANSRYFEHNIGIKARECPMLQTLAEASLCPLSAELQPRVGLARQLWRKHLLARLNLHEMNDTAFRELLFADVPQELFELEIKTIEKENFAWHHNQQFIHQPSARRAAWEPYLKSLLATNRPLEAQLFGLLGLRSSPETDRQLLAWLQAAPKERLPVIHHVPFGDGLLIDTLCSQPDGEWLAWCEQLIFETLRRGWLRVNYQWEATQLWEGWRKKMERQQRVAAAETIRQIQLKYLEFCEVSGLNNGVEDKTYLAEAATKIRAHLYPQAEPPAKTKRPTENREPYQGVWRQPCPPLDETSLPGARVLLDSRRETDGHALGACTLFDGERFWCVGRNQTELLVEGFDEHSDQPLRASWPENAQGLLAHSEAPPASLAVWRGTLFVSGAQHIHAVHRAAGAATLREPPALESWIAPGSSADAVACISALVAGPDALYIGVVWLQSSEHERLLRQRGAIYRWTPELPAPQKVCASDGLDAGPLNNCLAYALVDGVRQPATDALIFYLKGNTELAGWGPAHAGHRGKSSETHAANEGTLQPSLYEAGQREGVWKFMPANGAWTFLHGRFPYERLLRAWKPLVSQGVAADPRDADGQAWSRLAGPRDPSENDSVAVRALPPDFGWEAQPQFAVWPPVMGVALHEGHYVIGRTDPQGELVQTYARCALKGWHKWLAAVRGQRGAFLALQEQRRLRVWYCPLTEGTPTNAAHQPERTP